MKLIMDKRLKVPEAVIERLIDLAFEEDKVENDLTSRTLIPEKLQTKAILLAKADGVLAGIDIARRVFRRLNNRINFDIKVQDGQPLSPGTVIAEISGNARAVLSGERTALNFMQHLSGIASLTSEYMSAVGDLPVWVIDTRKTTPGYRLLEKYAVLMGGGRNHRFDLSDGILIKDNHIALLRSQGLDIADMVRTAKKAAPKGIKVEAETTNISEVEEALSAGADIIMFDNMSVDSMKKAAKLVGAEAWTEASGGVTLKTLRRIAETGVTMISVGALTHSAKALDISLEVITD